MEKLTAKDLTEAVRELTRQHPIGVANKMAFLNLEVDADYVAVTASGQVYEYEIKISRGDYLRDRQKARHAIYSGERVGKRPQGKRPNRFWYVTLPGIVKDDLPSYAGLIEICEGRLVEIVKAPLLQRETHELKTILRFAKAMRERGS